MSETNRSTFSLWMQAIRPFSYTATLIPVLVGAMITLVLFNGPVNWNLMLLIAIGSPLFQLGGNLLSEYYDFMHGIDRPETFGSSRVLVDGLMKPNQIFIAGIFALAACTLLGLVLVYFRGINMLIIGGIGIIGSVLYSYLKYRAFGDLQIFLCFGPLMIYGTFFALTGSMTMISEIFLISVPVGFLVVAILHANNTRDIKHDTLSGIRTLASVIGIGGSKFEYYFLEFGAYIAVALFVVFGLLEPWVLIVLLSLPPALKNVKSMTSAEVENPENIRMLDVLTAQHHMLFGLLYSIGILISKFI